LSPAPRGSCSRVVLGALPLLVYGALACDPARRPARTGLDEDFARLLPQAAGGAGAARAPARSAPTPGEWRRARERLRTLRRDGEGAGERTLRVRLALREPRTGRSVEARGAVALAPSLRGAPGEPAGALRMILLGPGGTTAMDLWARGDRFRFAVPALGLERRGDKATSPAALRGLPVDFLRWWLLRPASGELLWYERLGSADAFVLRDGPAIIELRAVDGGPVGARRTTWLSGGAEGGLGRAEAGARRLIDEEVVIAERMGCGTVRYAQASTGLMVTVICEGEERGRRPDPRAFVDPDEREAGGLTAPATPAGARARASFAAGEGGS
jgi:hypothetical protein